MIRLQAELTTIYEQLKEANAKNEKLKSSNELYKRKLEERIKEKENEINILNEKVKSFDLKKVRDAVLEEATNHYELKIKELHNENDRIREQYNNLHYDHAVMKCKLESHESEYSHALERIKLQHHNEVEQLQNKIQLLEKEKSSPSDTYAVELKSAKREVLQLSSKIKIVLAECDELRARNENLTLEMNSIKRTYSKQSADNLNNIRALESEKQRIAMQKEVLEKELSNSQEHRRVLNNELQATRKEVFLLKNKVEECEHQCQMKIANLQVETEQWRSEKESENEQLNEEISRLKSELRSVTADLANAHRVLTTKEQEFQQSLLTAKQQFWKQSNDLQQEKDRFEQKLRDLKNTTDQVIVQLNQDLLATKQNLHHCIESKSELEKELTSLKGGLEKNSGSNTFEDLSKQNLQYKKEIQDLMERINYLTISNNELLEQKERILRESASRKIPESHIENGHEILQLKLNWEQQKLQYHQRLEDLESQLRESKNSSVAEKRDLEQKIKQYTRLIAKLKEKLDTQKSLKEELEAEKEVLEKNVPYEAYSRVKNQLIELQRRVEEYRLVVSSEPNLSNLKSEQVSDKLLTDIKNLKLPSLSRRYKENMDDSFKVEKEMMTERILQAKKNVQVRRKSRKVRDKAHQISKTASPVISSSSDLDLQNLR